MAVLEGGAALPVTTGGTGPTEGRTAAIPVYVVSGGPVLGQRARRVVVVTSGPVVGRAAIPVYDMGANALYSTEAALPVYVVPGGGLLGVFERLQVLAAGGYYYDSIAAFTGLSGAIASWAPVIGANAAAQATGANQPIVGALNGKPAAVFDGTNDNLQTAVFGANINAPYTVLCVHQRTGATSGVSRIIHDGIAAGNRAAMYHQGSNDMIAARGSLAIGGNVASSLNAAITRVVYNGASSRIYLNGVADLVGDAGTSVLSGISLGAVFNAGSGYFPGSIAAYMLIPNSADGDARVIEAERLLQSRYGFQLTQTFYDGDSRSTGSWPIDANALASNSTHQPIGFPYNTLAAGGRTVATMIASDVSTIASQKRTDLNVRAVVWGGLNDDANGVGATYDVIYTRLATLCIAIRALGIPTIVCTEIDAQGSGPRWHTSYLQLNTLIRNGWPTFANGMADLGAIPQLQDASNLTYFAVDQVHPNATGYAFIPPVVGAVLATV